MAIRGIFDRKKKLGFKEKHRSREEINQEYNHHAVMFGHITRIIADNQKLLEVHLEHMQRLNQEGSKLPPEQPKVEPPKEPEGPKSIA